MESTCLIPLSRLVRRLAIVVSWVALAGVLASPASPAPAPQPVTLAAPRVVPVGGLPADAAIDDVDLDGDLDLAVSTDDGRVAILLGDGKGGFGAPSTFVAGSTARRLAFARLDADALPDLAVAITNGKAEDAIAAFRGDGRGGFVHVLGEPTMSDVSGLATGDFAVGAGMDAVASVWDGEIAWLHLVLASGKGGFSGRTRSVFLGNDPPGQVAAGDVDRDGTLDAVVTMPGADSVLVALGIANGDEAFAVVPYAAGTQPGDVALGDLNADGTPDVVVTNGFPGGVSVMLGRGGGALAAPTPVTLDGVPDGVQVADLNGDGKLDVVTAQPDRSAVSVLLGDGTGALASAAQHPAGIGAAGVRVGDLDGDGRPDVVVLNSRLDGLSVLRNTTEPPRTAGARDTTIAVTSSLNPSRVGDAVVYGAAITPAPDAGTVSFTDNGTAIPGCDARPLGSLCAVTYDDDGVHTVAARYSGSAAFATSVSDPLTQTVGRPDVVMGESTVAEPPAVLPPPTRTLSVNITGNGTVLGVPAGNLRVAAQAPIACGLRGFRCAADFRPGRRVTLRAVPGPGFTFKRWRGVCKGAARTCTVLVAFVRSVTAEFAPRAGTLPLKVAMGGTAFDVAWSRSVGRGELRVRGRALDPAIVRVELRRPHGGPLSVVQVSVDAGAFTRRARLLPGLLPQGARLLPGAFVVVVRARSGGRELPLQLQAVVLRPPVEGVVRQSFPSGARTGAPTPVPAGATIAYARFRMAAQPARGRRLTVSWYWPDGRLLGTVAKANRPEVVTFIRAATPLPTGTWKVTLRAGRTIVKEQLVRIR